MVTVIKCFNIRIYVYGKLVTYNIIFYSIRQQNHPKDLFIRRLSLKGMTNQANRLTKADDFTQKTMRAYLVIFLGKE